MYERGRGDRRGAFVGTEQIRNGAEDNAPAADAIDCDQQFARRCLHQHLRAARRAALEARGQARQVGRDFMRRQAARRASS